MKRIEKEIKKNSAQLIESSLPEIDSLDNIPYKAKQHKRLPLIFIPVGAVALMAIAIMVPALMMKQGSNNNNNTTHTYNFDFANYRPSFNSFNEVAYYSYIAYKDTSNDSKNLVPQKHNKITMLNGENEDQSNDEIQVYVDVYGRTHYPIPLEDTYTFSNFLYFEFDTVDNVFLEERIGNGHIHGLALDLSIFDEQMLILKNGESYYSCLVNGGGNNGLDNRWFIEFSAHKTIEGFDIVKDITNKRYLTLGFSDMTDFSTLDVINIEGSQFPIDSQLVHYDNVSITSSFAEIREQLALNPDYKVADGYGGVDSLVYNAEQPETNTFTLDEFEGTFTVNEGAISLKGKEIVSIGNATKVYASEINKDSHRDLVFETTEESVRYFNIYDINNQKYLYRNAVTTIGKYNYFLDMKDNRLIVKSLEPKMTDDAYLIDYGYFAYYANEGVTIAWQNLFALTDMRLTGVFEASGETPVEFIDGHYRFNSNTPYIIEFRMSKYPGYENPDYPSAIEHPFVCRPYGDINNMPNKTPDFSYISMENGVYRYQITFQEKGYCYYRISFYRFGFDLRVAVDEPVEAE